MHLATFYQNPLATFILLFSYTVHNIATYQLFAIFVQSLP